MLAVRLRKAREHNAPSLIVLGPLIVTEDVGHEALWLALVNEVRQPRAHALNCSVTDSARMCSECTPSILVSEVWALVNGPSAGGPKAVYGWLTSSTDGRDTGGRLRTARCRLRMAIDDYYCTYRC